MDPRVEIENLKNELVILKPQNHSDIPSLLVKLSGLYRRSFDLMGSILDEIGERIKASESTWCDQCYQQFANYAGMTSHRRKVHPTAPEIGDGPAHGKYAKKNK